MTKILITNSGTALDKGDAALLNSRIETLRELIPDADFTVLTYYPETACSQNELRTFEVIAKPVSLSLIFGGIAFIVFIRPWSVAHKYLGKIVDVSIKGKKLHEIANKYDVEMVKILVKRSLTSLFITISSIFQCVLWAALHKYLHLNVSMLIRGKRLQEYYNADVIINTGGDGLTETSPSFYFIINLLFGVLLDKTVVLYGESVSINRFKGLSAFIAGFTLNRVSLITLREEISKKALQELKINKTPIYITADSAFLLKTAPTQRVNEILTREKIDKESGPVVGFSVSGFATRFVSSYKSPEEKQEEYVRVLARVVDYLIDKLNATVIFVPHNIAPGADDRIVANAICQRVEHKQKVISITNDYTPEELKGIIGVCDLFIGTRMHATIASTSMYVPTIAIAYGHKAHGIIGEMLSQEKYVLDIEELDYDTLIPKINDAWNNKEEIKKELESRIEIVKKCALLNAQLVKELLEDSKTPKPNVSK